MKKWIRIEYIISIAIVSVIIWTAFQLKAENNDLRKNGIIVNAEIIEYLGSTPLRNGQDPDFLCRFFFEGKRMELISTNSSVYSPRGRSYVGKTYPALYSEKYNVIKLLINSKDYDKYGLKYPDSLLYR